MPSVLRDGVSLYYEVHGDVAHEPVVLLMGLAIDGQGWDLQVTALAACHGVIVIDNRGVGRSDKPAGPYTSAMLAEDVRAVLDALDVPRAHVVGLSMGGLVAQELALAYPARVASLVLACTYARPAPGLRQLNDDLHAAATLAAEPFGMGFVDRHGPDARRALAFVILPAAFTPEFLVLRRGYLGQLAGRMLAYRFPISAFFGQLAASAHHDAAARLPALRLPTLVLAGACDNIVAPSHSEELARLIEGARLVIVAGAPHAVNVEKPGEFNAELLAFFAANPC